MQNNVIDAKVVKDLSIFKIGGWNDLQPSNQQSHELETEIHPF